jgi:hypothetical protein
MHVYTRGNPSFSKFNDSQIDFGAWGSLNRSVAHWKGSVTKVGFAGFVRARTYLQKIMMLAIGRSASLCRRVYSGDRHYLASPIVNRYFDTTFLKHR